MKGSGEFRNVSVGTEVNCLLYGWGTVITNDSLSKPNYTYPIDVEFYCGAVRSYTKDGYLFESSVNKSLYLNEVKVKELPPKLKVDTKLLVWQHNKRECEKRYFKEFSKCGTKVICFREGSTSFSNRYPDGFVWSNWEVYNEQ